MDGNGNDHRRWDDFVVTMISLKNDSDYFFQFLGRESPNSLPWPSQGCHSRMFL
jgi:hypothetical protein